MEPFHAPHRPKPPLFGGTPHHPVTFHTTPFTTSPRSVPSFLCHPSCFVTIHCPQILSKFVLWTQPYLATYFPHPNPEKKNTSINNILQQPQKTYHHMIHTSHQHWNPEIHHAISTRHITSSSSTELELLLELLEDSALGSVSGSTVISPVEVVPTGDRPWKVGVGSTQLPKCRISTLNPQKNTHSKHFEKALWCLVGWVNYIGWPKKQGEAWQWLIVLPGCLLGLLRDFHRLHQSKWSSFYVLVTYIHGKYRLQQKKSQQAHVTKYDTPPED